MKDSKIRWTTNTWNVFTGCDKVSPGCTNCYAELIAETKRGTPAFPNGFEVTPRLHKMRDPLKWKKPSRIFVNSMSDMWHPDIPKENVKEMFAVMNQASWHQFQILTKRPGYGLTMAKEVEWTPNIHMGVSVENADYMNRIKTLKKIPAAVRFLSCEPLLGPIDLTDVLADGSIHWVIDGGESGPKRRPGDYDWFRQIRDACLDAGVAYLHKQGFAYRSEQDAVLDGRTWDQYPLPIGCNDPSLIGVYEEVLDERGSGLLDV